jgi:hypothetical protein
MKKTQKGILPLVLMVVLLFVITSCKKEEVNNDPGNINLTLPANSAMNVALNEKLSWQAVADPDGDNVTYDVYFGTDATPVTVTSAGQAGATYTPTLTANTTYYWKVVAKDPKGGTSQSAIWSFSTLNNSPGAVTLTAPADLETSVAFDATLSWQVVTDPDGDAVIYDVYFGTEVTPATVVSNGQEATTFTTVLEPGTTYYWKVVAIDENGGTSESAVWSFTSRLIQVGDFYEGGIVFYVDASGEHGLVCPKVDTNPVLPELHAGWGCNNGTDINGADGTAIGTGAQNTLDILAGCDMEGIAADMCATLTLNGYSDWFLPSIDELGAMKQNKEIINTYALAHGGTAFTNAYYYSSSESNSTYALAHGFYQINNMFLVGKSNFNYPFRAVRAF